MAEQMLTKLSHVLRMIAHVCSASCAHTRHIFGPDEEKWFIFGIHRIAGADLLTSVGVDLVDMSHCQFVSYPSCYEGEDSNILSRLRVAGTRRDVAMFL